LISTSAAIALLTLALPYVPLSQSWLGFVALPWPLLSSIIGIVIAYVALSEVLKRRIGVLGASSVAQLEGDAQQPRTFFRRSRRP
jgi:asparagine N-glycosylation enzyme membrane subunit Stt3